MAIGAPILTSPVKASPVATFAPTPATLPYSAVANQAGAAPVASDYNPALDASMGIYGNVQDATMRQGGPVARVPVTSGNTGQTGAAQTFDATFGGYLSPGAAGAQLGGTPPAPIAPAPTGAGNPPIPGDPYGRYIAGGMPGNQPAGTPTGAAENPVRQTYTVTRQGQAGGAVNAEQGPPTPQSQTPATPQPISSRPDTGGLMVGGRNFWTPLARLFGFNVGDAGGGNAGNPPTAETSDQNIPVRGQGSAADRAGSAGGAPGDQGGGTAGGPAGQGGTGDVLDRTVAAGTGQAVLRPDEGFVTGTPYQERLIRGLGEQANLQMDAIQRKYQQQRENLRASLAARGLLDSGVGAQSEAELMAQADNELRQAATSMYNQASTVMAGAQQQSVDNAFKLSGLDLDINRLNLNTQQVGEGLRLNEQQFVEWANNMHQTYGLDLAKLYEARNQFNASQAMTAYTTQQQSSMPAYLDYLAKIQTGQMNAQTSAMQSGVQQYLGGLEYNASLNRDTGNLLASAQPTEASRLRNTTIVNQRIS